MEKTSYPERGGWDSNPSHQSPAAMDPIAPASAGTNFVSMGVAMFLNFGDNFDVAG